MYCPNCNEEYSGKFCPECGAKLIEKPAGGFNLNLGDANAISGGVHLADSHNVHNEDRSVHNITNTTSTVQNITNIAAQKTEAEMLQERKEAYLNACKRAYEDNVLEQHEVIELEELRIKLGLDKATADAILDSVRRMSERNARKSTLSPIARTKLKILTENLKNNEVKALMDQIDSLESLVRKFDSDELSRKYFLVLAALKSERCVELYETSMIDSYWKSFWGYLAYIKQGQKAKAENVLISLDRFTNYPEDNMSVLAVAGALMKGNIVEAKEYLNELTGDHTPALQRFVDSLYLLLEPEVAKEMGADENTCAFYLVNFFGQKDPKSKAEEEHLKQTTEEGLNRHDNPKWNDITETVFSDFSSKLSNKRGSDLRVHVKVYLHDVAHGVKKKLKLPRLILCQHCHGTGAKDGTALETCPNCHGNGVEIRVQRTLHDNMQPQSTCQRCGGSGKIIKENCQHCGGQGIVRKEDIVTVNIPAGVAEGMTLKMSGRGNDAPGGGMPGDLLIVIEEERNTQLMRDDNDLVYILMLDSTTAMFGGKVEVPTIDGRARVTIPANTPSGKLLRLRGKGLPSPNSYSNGDLLIYVIVYVPEQLTEPERVSISSGHVDTVVNWLNKAAEQGRADAQYGLGRFYYHGQGVEKDYLKAAEWYLKAAEQGETLAMNCLAKLYKCGDGVEKSAQNALFWIMKASENGNNDAKSEEDNLRKEVIDELLKRFEEFGVKSMWCAIYPGDPNLYPIVDIQEMTYDELDKISPKNDGISWNVVARKERAKRRKELMDRMDKVLKEHEQGKFSKDEWKSIKKQYREEIETYNNFKPSESKVLVFFTTGDFKKRNSSGGYDMVKLNHRPLFAWNPCILCHEDLNPITMTNLGHSKTVWPLRGLFKNHMIITSDDNVVKDNINKQISQYLDDFIVQAVNGYGINKVVIYDNQLQKYMMVSKVLRVKNSNEENLKLNLLGDFKPSEICDMLNGKSHMWDYLFIND